MVELDGSEWIKLLSQDHEPSKERLICQARFRKTLRVRKGEWGRYFSGWDGLAIQPGEEIEILPRAEGGPNLELPDWAIEQLALSAGDNTCITHSTSSRSSTRSKGMAVGEMTCSGRPTT